MQGISADLRRRRFNRRIRPHLSGARVNDPIKSGVTQEEDLVGIARAIVGRRRGLDGLRIAAIRTARSNARVAKS